MAASWGENHWGSSGWGGSTLLNSNSAAGAVGLLTASISVDIGISRFLLEDGSGYLLLENGSYLMEEAGTGPIPNINGSVGIVAQTTALTGVAETSAVGSTTQSTTVASTGVSATGNINTTPEDNSKLLTGAVASGGTGTLVPSITVSLNTGWGIGAWGYRAWGGNSQTTIGVVGSNLPVTQVDTTSASGLGSVGSLFFSSVIDLTGVAETSAVGSAAPNIEVASTGVSATGNTNTLPTVLQGIAVSGSVCILVPSITTSIIPGWGIGAWGEGVWGSASPAITGAVGSNGVEVQAASTGVFATGNTNAVSPDKTVAVSGTASTGDIGTAIYAISILLNNGWGGGAWGSGAWGSGATITGAVGSNGVEAQVALTGNATDGQTGTITYNRIEFITGLQGSGSIGGVTPSTTVNLGISRFLLEDGSGYLLLEDGSYLLEEASVVDSASWGANEWGAGSWGGSSTVINGTVGNIEGVKTFILSGIEATANVGATTPSTAVDLVTSWGSNSWGYGTWGGNSQTIIGSVGSAVYSPELKGVQASGSLGQMTPSITVDIGISRFVLEGTDLGWGLGTWGSGLWGSPVGYLLLEDGSYLLEEASAGPIPSINGAVGTVAPVTSVTLTSDLATGAVNEMIAVSPAIRGVHADGAVGASAANITIVLTGIASQGAAGYLATVRTVLLSGVVATGNVGILGVTKSYWDIIDDSQDANWVEIDNAQTAAWTAISNAQTSSWAQISNLQSPEWAVTSTIGTGWGANEWGYGTWGNPETQNTEWELIPVAFDQN